MALVVYKKNAANYLIIFVSVHLVPLRVRSVRSADSEEMKITIAANNRFFEFKEGDEMNFNCTDLSASNYTLKLTKGV
jgi:hypothetical protein